MEKCIHCGKEIDRENNEQYAVLWGPGDQDASIVGCLCMKCTAFFEDVTDEVVGVK